MPFKCVVPGCRSNYYHVKGTQSVPMMRYPTDPKMIKAWNEAICRVDFTPTPHSHVCIKHFRDDQLVPQESKRSEVATPSGKFPWTRRTSRLRMDAVPCVFEVDPSTHKMRPCYRPSKNIPRVQRRRECEILAGIKVEFKPEMWEENGEKTEEVEEPPVKRGRGRPRKHNPYIGVVNTKKNSNVIVKSEVVSCCALACTNTSENFIMNSLPQDPELRKVWIEKIDRLDWAPDDDAALCEVHFDEDMWDRDLGSEKALRSDAVPSLFLHGEAIKSWVTMDNTGNIADIIVDGRSTNDEDSTNGGSNHENTEESMDGSEQDEDEDPSMLVKREALEPEIDMVEGSEEDMVSREASSGEQFETIYCDSTFNDHEDSQDVFDDEQEDDDIIMDPPSLEEENPLAEERSSPILQDGEVSCMEDSNKTAAAAAASKYLVISMPNSYQSAKEKVIRRRNSSQLTDEFQCPICDRRLSRRKNLEIHIEKLHPFGEISEYQRKRKEIQQKQEDAANKAISKQTPAFKKPPPPLKPIVPQCLLSPSLPSIPIIPLNTQTPLATTSAGEGVVTPSFPIISFSSQSPLVSSSIQTPSSTVVTPTLVTSQPLISTQPLVAPNTIIASPTLMTTSTAGTIVTTPRPLDPSPAGGEVRKQFLLLLPKQAMIPKPPPPKKVEAKPKPPPKPAEQPSAATDDTSLYSVNLSEIPLDKRLRLKDKLRELVDAVVKKKLNPDKIIIAYDRT